MKIGVSLKIDVTKIDKARLHKGEKGTYMDLTTFIDTANPGQYGDHGFISQSVSEDERAQKVRTPILGNCKVFYFGDETQSGNAEPQSGNVTQETPQPTPPPFESTEEGIDDIPFN